MNDKLIKFLVALSQSENSQFETELRSEVDSLGFVSFFINYINPAFNDIMQANECALINVSTTSINKKLFVTINLNGKIK
jgi:hypothetical protein